MSTPFVYHCVTVLAVVAGCTLFAISPSLLTAVACLLGVYAVSRCMDERVRANTRVPCEDKTVLVTGCDTGFGYALARQLAASGVTVFAGCLRSSGDGATSLKEGHTEMIHVLQMDVTDDTQIGQCVEYVNQVTRNQGLWGLVNNAGLNFMGDIELTTMEQFERVVNINQLGMVRVTKAFLPLIRQKQGRIVNVTSVKGRISEAYNAAYCMTKFAGETFSDILYLEMVKFGVGVSIIEPGNFGGATGCLEANRILGDFEEMWRVLPDEAREVYGKDYVMHHPRAAQKAVPTACMDLSRVTDAMVDALFTVHPKKRYLIGGSNKRYDHYKLMTLFTPLMPDWFMHRKQMEVVAAFPPVRSNTNKNKHM